jgi:hypothetical protein
MTSQTDGVVAAGQTHSIAGDGLLGGTDARVELRETRVYS